MTKNTINFQFKNTITKTILSTAGSNNFEDCILNKYLSPIIWSANPK
jgi:hypothetical protein